MLNENLKSIRKSRGMSQEELAGKVNVVRQTISKWEKGLSVPDSDLLICLSEVLETPVSILLGERVDEPKSDDLKTISEKLELINLEFAKRKTRKRRLLHGGCILLCTLIAAAFLLIYLWKSPYLGWDYTNPEIAVMGVGFHSLEWCFVRLAPILFIGAILAAFWSRKKR